MNTEQKFNLLISEEKSFLSFFKANFPLFHNSNLFLRDFQYSIKRFLELKGYKINFKEVDTLSKMYVIFFEGNGTFIKINHFTWKLNYTDFITSPPLKQEEVVSK
ncbi:MAG: hypothetical protein C0425_10390 [Chlorobiaceae bacterium]|nr:hypothetical protein [Chlorobiaceae bacterium]MBA4310725.1 hypothetical protein [Chlorobiaceae bacterium]